MGERKKITVLSARELYGDERRAREKWCIMKTDKYGVLIDRR